MYFKEANVILCFIYCFLQNTPTYHLPKHKRVPFWHVRAWFGTIFHCPVNEWIFDAFSFNFPEMLCSFSRFCQIHIVFQAWYTNIFTDNKNFIYNINISVNKCERSINSSDISEYEGVADVECCSKNYNSSNSTLPLWKVYNDDTKNWMTLLQRFQRTRRQKIWMPFLLGMLCKYRSQKSDIRAAR